MSSALKKYAFINAKLRARMSTLLNDEFFLRSVRAHTTDELLPYFDDTRYRFLIDLYRQSADIGLMELALFEHEALEIQDIQKHLCKTEQITVDAWGKRYELQVFRTVLRLWFDRSIRRRKIDELLPYVCRNTRIHCLPVDKLLASDSNTFADAAHSTLYGPVVKEMIHEVQEQKSIFKLEIACDKLYYQSLFKAFDILAPRDRDIVHSLIGIEVDMENINRFVRMNQFYKLTSNELIETLIPNGKNISLDIFHEAAEKKEPTGLGLELFSRTYGKYLILSSGSSGENRQGLSVIEKLFSLIIEEEVKKVCSGYPFTIGIIFAWLIRKHIEVRRIKTLINAVHLKIRTERSEMHFV